MELPAHHKSPIKQSLTVAVLALLIAILSLALTGCAGVAPAARPEATPQPLPISADQLERQYGLRVNVLAVTAAGGMVDLRLKVLDAAKAAELLAKAPTLQVADTRAVLSAGDAGLPQDLKPVEGRLLYVLYPNSGNAVKPGANVAITFGDVQLEPVVAK